ncbi:MAG: hypothetical protein R2857_10250 [Vampirovibrionales bacterium]
MPPSTMFVGCGWPNPTDAQQWCTLTFAEGLALRQAAAGPVALEVNLLGEALKPVQILSPQQVKVMLMPYSVKTLQFELV